MNFFNQIFLDFMLNVEIISIEGPVFQGEAFLVVVPTLSGDIGFMEDHESLVAELKEGNVEIFAQNDKKINEFPVKSGVVQMHEGEKLVILSDS